MQQKVIQAKILTIIKKTFQIGELLRELFLATI